MDIGQNFRTISLAQEGDHRNDDQQGLEPLAQQDSERADEGRSIARRIGREHLLGIGEQAFDDSCLAGDVVRRCAASDSAPELAHGLFDARHKGRVARGQDRFNRFEPVEIG